MLPYFPLAASVGLLGVVQVTTSVPMHQSSFHPTLWGHGFSPEPQSPQLYQPSNEVDLDDIDTSGLRDFWASHSQSTVTPPSSPPSPAAILTQRTFPSTSDARSQMLAKAPQTRRDKRRQRAKAVQFHPVAMSLPLPTSPYAISNDHSLRQDALQSTQSSAAIAASSRGSTKRKSQAASSSSLEKQRVTSEVDEFASRYHLFNKYDWQKSRTEQDVRSIYQAVASQWRPMVRNTLIDSIDRLGQKIEANRHWIDPILANNKAMISVAVDESAPRPPVPGRIKSSQPLIKFDDLMASGVVEKAKNIRYLTNTGLRRQFTRRPMWAPKDMDRSLQKTFLTRSAIYWGINEGAAKSRLYSHDDGEIVALVKTLMPEYRPSASNGHVESSKGAAKATRTYLHPIRQ